MSEVYEVKETNAIYNNPTALERLENYGKEMLTNTELLEVLLKVNEQTAEKIFEQFETLFGLKQASLEELQKVENIGEKRASQILAMIELGKRIQIAPRERTETVRSSYSLAHQLIQEMKDYEQEQLIALYLDTKNKIIRKRTIFIGSLNQSVCHPREIFREAVKLSAASIILAHNHPSGNQTPSTEDRDITNRIKNVGKEIGIELLDHLVLGDEDYYSFREEGKI